MCVWDFLIAMVVKEQGIKRVIKMSCKPETQGSTWNWTNGSWEQVGGKNYLCGRDITNKNTQK